MKGVIRPKRRRRRSIKKKKAACPDCALHRRHISSLEGRLAYLESKLSARLVGVAGRFDLLADRMRHDAEQFNSLYDKSGMLYRLIGELVRRIRELTPSYQGRRADEDE